MTLGSPAEVAKLKVDGRLLMETVLGGAAEGDGLNPGSLEIGPTGGLIQEEDAIELLLCVPRAGRMESRFRSHFCDWMISAMAPLFSAGRRRR